MSYIGESKCFSERICQHRNDVRMIEVQCSALAEHCEEHDHNIDFDSASVIETEKNLEKRLLLESWHIQHTPANMNRSLGTMPLKRDGKGKTEHKTRDVHASLTITVIPEEETKPVSKRHVFYKIVTGGDSLP